MENMPPKNINPKTTKKRIIPGLLSGAPRVKTRPEIRKSGKNPTTIMMTPETIWPKGVFRPLPGGCGCPGILEPRPRLILRVFAKEHATLASSTGYSTFRTVTSGPGSPYITYLSKAIFHSIFDSNMIFSFFWLGLRLLLALELEVADLTSTAFRQPDFGSITRMSKGADPSMSMTMPSGYSFSRLSTVFQRPRRLLTLSFVSPVGFPGSISLFLDAIHE